MPSTSSGIGTGGARPGKSPSVAKYPYPTSNSLEDILSAIREILVRHGGGVHSFRVTVGQPIEVELRAPEAGEPTGEPPILLSDIVRKVPLEKVSGKFDSPESILGRIVHKAAQDQGVANFIVVGDKAAFCRWFSRGKDMDLKSALGMSIHVAPGAVPLDAAVICVTPTKIATPLDVYRGFLLYLDPLKPREIQV